MLIEKFPIVEEILTQIASALPRVAMAILIFIFGYFISKIVAGSVKKLLRTIGIDKLGDKINQIDIIEKANIKIKPSNILGKIIYYLLLLIFIIMAADVMAINAITDLLQQLINLIPKILVALIILFVGLMFSDTVRKMVLTLSKSLNLPSASLISNAIFYFLLINVLITALAQTGIDSDFIEGNFMIIIGGAVLAFAMGYGLASKDLVSNFLSSFYVKDQFKEGDRIRIDGVEGEILEFDKSFVKIKTQNSTVLIPISKTLKDKIEIINQT